MIQQIQPPLPPLPIHQPCCCPRCLILPSLCPLLCCPPHACLMCFSASQSVLCLFQMDVTHLHALCFVPAMMFNCKVFTEDLGKVLVRAGIGGRCPLLLWIKDGRAEVQHIPDVYAFFQIFKQLTLHHALQNINQQSKQMHTLTIATGSKYSVVLTRPKL